MKKPSWDDTEEIEDIPKFDDTEEIVEPSALEAVARGAGQGATFGFLDELLATLGTKGASPRQVISEPEKAIETEKEMLRQYEENLAEQREANKAAQEANPAAYMASEIGAGIIPGLVTGGATAAANVLKTGAKEALGEAAKLGAKYGAVSGAGYSEAETPLELAEDIALGTSTGAVAGAALPYAARGAVKSAKSLGKGTKKLLETVIPESESIKAGFKYGTQGKKLSQEVLDKDIMDISKNILKNIKAEKKANNLKSVKEELTALGYKVDTKKAINEAIKDMEKLQKGDVLDLQNKEILPKLKKIAGYDLEGEKLAERAEKNILKKLIENEGKNSEAIIKGEKSLAKQALKTGDDLQTITDVDAPMSGLDIPLETQQGKIAGTAGKFKTPEGEEYVQKVLSDATEFQPEVSRVLGPDGRPIIKTVDKGTGRVSAIVGNIQDKLEQDLSSMTIDEAENLRKQINLATKLAKVSGASDDPIIQRAQELAKNLKDLTDAAIEKGGNTDLIGKRARFSDIFSAEELLGVNKRFSVRSDIDDLAKTKVIGEKLGFEKGFGTRQETQKAQELLGEKVVTPEMKSQLELLRKLNQISGRESQENISRAGLYRMAVGDLPNIAGRTVSNISKKIQPITSPVKNVIDVVNTMTKDQVNKLGTKFMNSESKGSQYLGQQLIDASKREGEAYNQAIWALSQSPAFRELMKRQVPQIEQEMRQDLGLEQNMSMEVDSGSENTREPSSLPILETIAEGEGGYDSMNQGTVRGRIYGSTHSAKDKLGKPLTEHTIGEIRALQSKVKTDRDNSAFAVGKYQIIPKTMEYLVKNMKLSDDQKFDEALQDKMGETLLKLKRPEAYKYLTGESDDIKEAAKALSKEWASLPNPDTGDSYYGQGNKAQHSIEDIYETLRKSREEVMKEIDRVNQLQSSGDDVPMAQLESLLQKIDMLNIDQKDKDMLENEAVNMQSFSDGERLKDLVRKIQGLS